MRAAVKQLALAPASVLAAVLVNISPVGPLLPPAGPFVFAVLGSAWFGGAIPGLLAAFLGALAMPQLFHVSTPLVGGLLDLHRFVAFAMMGVALGWGSARRAAKLREQERYATAMEASADGFWDWIPATGMAYASPRLLEIFGFTPGTTFTDRDDLMERIPFHPEDRPRLAIAIAEHFAGKLARLDIPMRFVRDREVRWVHLTAMAARDASGAVVRWTGTVRDITEWKRVEAALRASEERHALVIDASNEGFWDWIPEGDKLHLTPRFLEMFGFAPGTLFPGRAAMFEAWVMPPEDRAALHHTIGEHFAGKTPRMEKDFRILVDGNVRWIHARGLATRSSSGELVRWNGAVSDITARKGAEEALRVSEERHARAMEASAAGHWDWNMVTDELFVSERARDMFEVPAGPMPLTRTQFTSLMSKYRTDMDSGVTESLSTGTFDRIYRVVTRAGPVRWLNSRGKVYKDAAGKPVRMAGSMTDITERRNAEEALRSSAQRYALAMEAAGDGHTDWDLVSGEFYISPRLLEIIGHPPDAVFADRADWVRRFPFHPEDRPKWEQAMAAHFEGRDAHFKSEWRIVVRGEVRWTSFHFLSTRDEEGKPIRWVGSIGDITEQKRAEEALRASEERISLAMEASEEGYIDCDVQTDRFIVSERMREIFEVPPDTRIVYRSDFNKQFRFYSDEDATAYSDMSRVVAAKGGPDHYEFEFRAVLPSGKVKWIWTRSKVTRDAEGRALRRVGVVADVTARKTAEGALRTSEERFERAVAGSFDGIWDLDFVARTAYASARTRELLGLPPGPEVTPLDQWIAGLPLHPEDRPRRDAAVEAHLSGRAPVYEGEFRVLLQDGHYRWRHLHGVCVRDADGKPLRMAGSISDSDVRRRTEDALRESEVRYERVVAAAEAGFWDWDMVADHYYVSPKLIEMAGLPVGTVIAHRDDFRRLVPLHPEDMENWTRAIGQLAESGGTRLSMVVRMMLPGGMRWYRADGMCFRDTAGRIVRWTGSAIDITDTKVAEEALRKSEQRYELAMAASESGYWDWDVPSNHYFVSPRAFELAGFPSGTTWASRDDYEANINMHPDDFVKWEAERKALFEGTGERLAMEVRYLVKGQPRWHMLNAICKRDEAGNVIRWTGSATNITERKLAEEGLKALEHQLRQAQRLEAIGTLAGGIAHDFNNILGAILGYGEMAMRDAPQGSRLARDLDNIVIAGERGRALVDRVLAFSRSAVGERVPVHVERVVGEALDLVQGKLSPAVKLSAKLHARSAAVLGDATQVHQVVVNLVTNAVQAMPAGGVLRVDLAVELFAAPRATTIGELAAGEYVVLTVADTGAGIAQEILDRIFDPFFTTKEVGTGTGLGLSIVHGIVTELGGGIVVASKVGMGSTFTVYLPRSGDAVVPHDEKAWVLPRGNGQRVLVVDDEEALVELAIRALEGLGYEPTGFTSSVAALTAFRAAPERFDALLTDERMPGMPGSTLIREVRGIRDDLPIVLMSGYAGGTVPRRSRDAGANEVLRKPLSERDLAASFARVFQ